MIDRGSPHAGLQFQQTAAGQRKDLVRLGPLAVTATTSGGAQTLFTADTDTQINMQDMHIRNSTAGALYVYLMIDSTVVVEEEIPANSTEIYSLGGMPLYAGEAFKVYAAASSGITITGVGNRQN